LVWGYAVLVFGTTTSVSGAISLAAPVSLAAAISGQGVQIGQVYMEDNGVGSNPGRWLGTGSINAQDASGSLLRDTSANSTIPFTFGNTDKIEVTFCYEAA
jgi:hypothetical protein